MAIKSITSEELKSKLDKNEELILVDCREQDEWDAGHIEEARLIPLSVLEERFSELNEYKDKQIIMQCRSGKRSLNACHFLEEQGYSNLTNLEGGILGWGELGYKIIE